MIKRLLKKDGNLFVHLDWHSSHYVKVLLDEVFGYENFRNEIVWCYTGPSKVKKDFPKKHDIILRYSKTKNPRFYPVRIPYKSGIHDTKGTAMNYKGRKIDVNQLSHKGKVIEDWWTDIWATERYRKEYLYFDTQKPLKLLERIIHSTTKEGDLVGDFFLGSGSTIIAAEVMNRKWIGCDNSSVSYTFVNKRLAILKKTRKTITPYETYFQLQNSHFEEFPVGKNNFIEITKSKRPWKQKFLKELIINIQETNKLELSNDMLILGTLTGNKGEGTQKRSPLIAFKIKHDKKKEKIELFPFKYFLPEELIEKIRIEGEKIDLKGHETCLIDYVKTGFVWENNVYFSNIIYVDHSTKMDLHLKIPRKFNEECYLAVELGDLMGNVLIGFKKISG